MERIEGKCDICTKNDGERGHNLQKCKECSVLVHELCYGMVPTTCKNPNFTCHGCKAVLRGKEEEEDDIEVNVPSRVGGWILKDVLAKEEGVSSFREFLQQRAETDSDGENKLDFWMDTNEFQAANGIRVEEESLKKRAQHIFDTYCANNAERKVELPLDVLAEIEANIYNNSTTTEKAATATSITCALFDTARQHIHQSLEQTKLEKYKQSSPYKIYLAQQRTVMKQKERPTECVLCSVKNGIHAMHPLYDVDGKDGRQLVLSASGVGFMRKEKRLAWVHTLCAMFICSSERTGSLVYGCDEDGNWETQEEEEEEEGVVNRKVIDSDDEEDEPMASLGEEQLKFTKCEEIFQPLMKRLQQANNADSKDVNDILECIDSMMESVDLLTPPFVREYQIGQLVKRVKKNFESAHPEVKSRCKSLSAEMKRVYNEKEKKVPAGFEPVKNMKEGKMIDKDKVPNDNVSENDNGDDGNTNNASQANTDDAIEQKYKIGTAVSKEFLTGTHAGNITDYDSVTKLYQIIYEDGDSEDLNETEVSQLLLSYTAWFCMAAPVNGKEIHASQCIKSHREFICVICKKKDNASSKCLRIPVQCSAGDRYEFNEFKQYHKTLNKQMRLAKKRGEEHKGCAEPMHVGCARWGSDYAKVNKKHLRMCYYFSGKPPTYVGPDEYQDPVSNCFCRIHAIEIQEGLAKSSLLDGGGGEGKSEATNNARKRKGVDDADDSMSDVLIEHESDDSADKARRLRIAIAKKKKRRIMEESDEESE